MSDVLLVLDVSCLAYKAHFTTGHLTYQGNPTGVLFGLFRDLIALQQRFKTKHVAFCFDLGQSFRCNYFKAYKANRRDCYEEMKPEERMAVHAIRSQILKLRKDYLPMIGFNCIYAEDGYEADDLIASVCCGLGPTWKAVIVSTDQDLYQLLGKQVLMVNPTTGKLITRKTFKAEYGIKPRTWIKVKAMMGDNSDNIPGVKGVGVKTAIKYLSWDPDVKATPKLGQLFEAIEELKAEGNYKRNLELITLPWPGTPVCNLRADNITCKNWRRVMDRLGMAKLRDTPPLGAK